MTQLTDYERRKQMKQEQSIMIKLSDYLLKKGAITADEKVNLEQLIRKEGRKQCSGQ